MDIETPSDEFKNVSYNQSSFGKLKKHLVNEIDNDQHHLCLFLGNYKPNKDNAVEELASALGREVKYIDTSELVSRIESETFENLGHFFKGLEESDEILYFENGDELCGVYTGNTHSRVKYATPEERHFIKKVKAFKGLVILDIPEYIDADKTLRRAAQSIVSFDLPKSLLKRFVWHLKNYSLNGNDLKTKRPEADLEIT
ncbi:hypothetical protein [Fodinibius halophilus]|uniref:AAA family ATPase n=1 Tax=Fodinibius halophilus TaxID=1736908 RepID=A0A6M1T1X9_9BACT|nr:hypothetical protein [Fodinibius halophilus]NGP87999.1 hypothetical protein [Fodinibius halophilus]